MPRAGTVLATTVFALFLIFMPREASAGSCKITDSDLRSWEISSGFAFSGARGNTDKTDIGLRLCYEFDDKENRVTSKSKYEFGKVDGITNEDLWRSDLSYLRRIGGVASRGTRSVFFDLSSFAERDEINRLDLRFGIGGGLSADLPVSPTMKVNGKALIFWEREKRRSLPADDFASLHFGAGIEKKTANVKTSLSSVFIIPINETGDFRSETEASVSVPLSTAVSLQLATTLEYDNEPANETIRKTDFRYTTSLNFAL